MKKGILLSAAVAAALVIGCSQPATQIEWIKEDYKTALAKADKDGKLLMIDVYTDWCGPCKLLDKDTFPKQEVVDKSANFVTLKLDAEKGQGPGVQKQFGITGYPTILFVDGDGKLVHTVVGFIDAPSLVAEMDKALDKT